MRFTLTSWHGEHSSTFSVLDTSQPESEQPCIIHSWNTATEPNARYLAENFCDRHNAKEPAREHWQE